MIKDMFHTFKKIEINICMQFFIRVEQIQREGQKIPSWRLGPWI